MKYRVLIVQETIIDIDADNNYDASSQANDIAYKLNAKVADYYPTREEVEEL